jgi:hypothetical protein
MFCKCSRADAGTDPSYGEAAYFAFSGGFSSLIAF